eukprot:TRINITY_DN18855_c0_g2_i1.p1 TRINITY_DN18855_c0_g2~~TRINITY_DN18855_c0_g2_i1.p1  ORF type:complete len:396 (+),score=124.28 TRINITY_DN18855_c0_g2_i1:85-1272(+)
MPRRNLKLTLDVVEENEPTFDEPDAIDGVIEKVKNVKSSRKCASINYEDLEICEMLGRGVSGCVRRVINKPTGEVLALKDLNILDESKREQLMKEIEALYGAHCDALVDFYGVFFNDGKVSIAIEYMDCGSLDLVIKEATKIPEDVLCGMAYQSLEGLRYLKSTKRIHRDIKPQNILVNSRGEVKLTDFGISKEVENSVAMVMTFVGTFKYMSPERMVNEAYNSTSDIWSLGLTLMHAANGRYPYPELESMFDVIMNIQEQASPQLDRTIFSAEFCDLIDDCLKKDKNARPQPHEMMEHAWFKENGIVDMASAVQKVSDWMIKRGKSNPDGSSVKDVTFIEGGQMPPKAPVESKRIVESKESKEDDRPPLLRAESQTGSGKLRPIRRPAQRFRLK